MPLWSSLFPVLKVRHAIFWCIMSFFSLLLSLHNHPWTAVTVTMPMPVTVTVIASTSDFILNAYSIDILEAFFYPSLFWNARQNRSNESNILVSLGSSSALVALSILYTVSIPQGQSHPQFTQHSLDSISVPQGRSYPQLQQRLQILPFPHSLSLQHQNGLQKRLSSVTGRQYFLRTHICFLWALG